MKIQDENPYCSYSPVELIPRSNHWPLGKVDGFCKLWMKPHTLIKLLSWNHSDDGSFLGPCLV